MGQIQNEVAGLVNKLLVTKAGSELIQSDRETKAMEAQDRANEYYNTEVKQASKDSLDKTMKLANTNAERHKIGEKYGVQFKTIKEGPLIGGSAIDSIDESKLSKNPLAQKRQINRIEWANYDYNTALQANRVAAQQLSLKKDQYETFKKRAEILSRKAKIPMSEVLGSSSEESKELLGAAEWIDEKFKGGKKNG